MSTDSLSPKAQNGSSMSRIQQVEYCPPWTLVPHQPHHHQPSVVPSHEHLQTSALYKGLHPHAPCHLPDLPKLYSSYQINLIPAPWNSLPAAPPRLKHTSTLTLLLLLVSVELVYCERCSIDENHHYLHSSLFRKHHHVF